MAEWWDEDSLNFLTTHLARPRTSPIHWRKCGGFFGPKWFEAHFNTGACLALTKPAHAWRLVYYASAPRQITVETGSQERVIRAAVEFMARGKWALHEVEWEDRGHYRFGWNPRARDGLAMILYRRAGGYGSVFAVSREDPEDSFEQGPDDEYDGLLLAASQVLVTGLVPEARPRPRILRTSIGAFPCRLNLEKMRVVARCPRGRFTFVYRGPEVHELRFRDEDGVRHILGTGPVEELLAENWTLPERHRPAPSTATPSSKPPHQVFGEALARECKQRGLLTCGPLPEDEFTARLIDLAINEAAKIGGVTVNRKTRDHLDAVIRDRARRGEPISGIASDHVIEVTAHETTNTVAVAATDVEDLQPADPQTRGVFRRDREWDLSASPWRPVLVEPRAEPGALMRIEPHAQPGPIARIGGSERPGDEAARPDPTIEEPSEPDVDDLRELLVDHLDFARASLPAKKPGAASARRLLDAFLAAFDDGLGDIEGTYAVVIEELLPYMDRRMSVRAAIDAFALLDPLTPLLGRRHSRCLAVLLGQARDPASMVVQALVDLRRRHRG